MTTHKRLAAVAAATTIGLPFAWLILLETGWAHHWGWGWALVHLSATGRPGRHPRPVCRQAGSCAAAYAWMRRWTND